MARSSGILLHITSLPGRYGIGTLGGAAYAFIDFLERAGQKYWQVLPIHPTGFGDSPYQSFSTYAGNPYLIDLDLLCGQGLLRREECEALQWGEDPARVDFGLIYENKRTVLRLAYSRGFNPGDAAFIRFCEANKDWLEDYAVFMTAKQKWDMSAWPEWADEGLRRRREDSVRDFKEQNREDVDFYRFTQFLFFTQWETLKNYARSRGVQFIGDLPIYVSVDSADAWANRGLFYFNEANRCDLVAGCPPDFFSADGQYWGNPVYNWKVLKATRYSWWINRLASAARLYDVVRIDHFRGFESYYCIESSAGSARFGNWLPGPGMDFFREVNKRLPGIAIIAEDLGYLTQSVHDLLHQTGYPGMKVLQFAFDSDSANVYLPHNHIQNSVVYTGTHDNTTIAGWIYDSPGPQVEFAKKYGAMTEHEGYNWGMIRLAYGSVANLAIVPMQDFLNLPASARMNRPATLGENWQWRMQMDYAAECLLLKIKKTAELYGRCR